MPNNDKASLRDSLNIIWVIASKDILDALKNRLVITMIIMLSVMLLVPKMLPLIFEQPQTMLPIYDLGDSILAFEKFDAAGINAQKVHSDQELRTALCGGIYPQIGLQLPVGIDQLLTAGTPIELQGFVCWSKRYQVSELQPKLEKMISQSLGQSVKIQLEGNIVYPPSEGVLFLSMATINSVMLILMMGVFLVPTLLHEEKETKTMEALLVSPASIGQVVIGKALAGSFYILVTAVVIFTISWVEVIHWDMAILFVVSGGVFSVALGLVLGSFFEKQQDMIGWMSALILLMIGSILMKMLDIELPAFLQSLLPWTPSVALAELCSAAYSEIVSVARMWNNLGIVLIMSLPLYALVIWKVRHSDR